MDTIYCVECPKELKLPKTDDRVRRINSNNKQFCDIFFPTTPYRRSNSHIHTGRREQANLTLHTLSTHWTIAPTVTWPRKSTYNNKTAMRLTAQSTFMESQDFYGNCQIRRHWHRKVILFVKKNGKS